MSVRYNMGYLILAFILSSCASKPITLQDIQSRTKPGMSSADVMAVLGLPDRYERLLQNNRILQYRENGLYFVEDHLSHNFKLSDPHDINIVTAKGDISKCDSFSFKSENNLFLRFAQEQVSEQLKAHGLKSTGGHHTCVATLIYTSVKKTKSEVADQLRSLNSYSIQANADFNPQYYLSLFAPKGDAFKVAVDNTADDVFERKLEVKLEQKNAEVWNVSVTSISNTMDDQNQFPYMVSSISEVNQIENAYDIVFYNDQRVVGDIDKIKIVPANELILKKDAELSAPAFQIMAYLGDEALYRQAVSVLNLNGFTMNSNALCVAIRAGFVKAAEDIVKNEHYNPDIQFKDARGGYILPRNCIQYVNKEQSQEVMQQMKSAQKQKDETEAKQEAETGKKENKYLNFDWDAVWKFLEPVKPGSQNQPK